MKQEKKTIFFIITRGIIVRNLLRNKYFSELLNGKYKIVLILVKNYLEKPDEYFFNEFNDENIKIEIVKKESLGKLEKLLDLFAANLVITKSRKKYLRHNVRKEKRMNFFVYYFSIIFFWPLTKIVFLKVFYRWLVLKMRIVNKRQYLDLFDKYNPSLIFSTTIVTSTDVAFLKIGRLKGIKTVSMPRSWDNLDKYPFKFVPDLLLVQNEVMKETAVKIQDFNSEIIKVVGFPQFDIYKDTEIILSKKQYCQKKNFNPELPILFLGSEGPWSKGDNKIFEDIIKNRGDVIPDCNILVRPHWGHLKLYNYDDFKKYENVFIDDKFRMTDFFHDNWDPSIDNMIDFTNSLYHCNIMIAFSSTLTLDAVSFNKPIITVSYGIAFKKNRNDVTYMMYETGHFIRVKNTHGTSLVYSLDELLDTINLYLKNSNHKNDARKELLDKLCYKVDGKSGERIYNEIINLLNK